jgi:hypothetical protein
MPGLPRELIMSFKFINGFIFKKANSIIQPKDEELNNFMNNFSKNHKIDIVDDSDEKIPHQKANEIVKNYFDNKINLKDLIESHYHPDLHNRMKITLPQNSYWKIGVDNDAYKPGNIKPNQKLPISDFSSQYNYYENEPDGQKYANMDSIYNDSDIRNLGKDYIKKQLDLAHRGGLNYISLYPTSNTEGTMIGSSYWANAGVNFRNPQIAINEFRSRLKNQFNNPNNVEVYKYLNNNARKIEYPHDLLKLIENAYKKYPQLKKQAKNHYDLFSKILQSYPAIIHLDNPENPGYKRMMNYYFGNNN